MDDRNLIASADLGQDQFVVLAAMKKGTSFEVAGCGIEASKGYSRGRIIDIGEASDALSKAVRQAELMAGSRLGSKVEIDGLVVGGVCGGHIQGEDKRAHVKVQGGAVSAADIDLALDTLQAFPIEQGLEILHVLEQEFSIDGQGGIRHPMGMRGSLLEAEAHVVKAASNALANHRSCMEQAGARPLKMMSTALATGVSVTTEDERELGVVSLDWGGGTCDCTVFKGGVPRMLKTLPIGGSDVDRDVAKIFHISMSSAERIKRKIGNAEQVQVDENAKVRVDSADDGDEVEVEPHVLSMTIQPRVEEMLEQVRDTLGPGVDKESMSAGVVISGGMASLSGIVPLASEVLAMPVRTSKANYTGDNAELVRGPEFAASLGLLELLVSQDGAEPVAEQAPGLGAWLKRLLFGGGPVTNTTQTS